MGLPEQAAHSDEKGSRINTDSGTESSKALDDGDSPPNPTNAGPLIQAKYGHDIEEEGGIYDADECVDVVGNGYTSPPSPPQLPAR